MAIDIKFDLVGNPEPLTIILANRNGNKLGQLKANDESIELSDKFNDALEFSFTINKYIDDKLTPLWEKVVDFKLVYCKEWDEWFEIKVELDEETETVKTVYCTQLGKAELSQIMLYDVEINTEEDIDRDDYKITVLYDEKDPKASLLDRLLEKAPHYSVKYVDPTIAKIQRSFSFDDKSIDDSFQEIAEEIGCLFVYDSNSTSIEDNLNNSVLKSSDDYLLKDYNDLYLIPEDSNGLKNLNVNKPHRTVSVFDLQQNCNKCGYRGEFTDVCPKCGATDIKYGYGEDTLIFVTSDELASGGIQLKADTDSVKNCFKLEAGDDLMTATVRNCNPNGTDYIWRFSDSLKEDMSGELIDKLESYDTEYKQYCDEHICDIDRNLLNEYNALVNKYSVYNKDLQKIETTIKGYSALMNAYYNVVDIALYLKSGLMPSVDMGGTTASEQVALLTTSNIPSIAVADVTNASLSTVNSAMLAMAKTIIKSTYKIQINTSGLVDVVNGKSWKGNFVITNYSDDKDTAVSAVITVPINDDLETFVKQKIDKELNKEETEDYSVSGLFKKEYEDFCVELKKYALNPLNSFYDACQSCIDILIEQGVGNKITWGSTSSDSDSNLYEKLYVPYYNKLTAIEDEIKVREDEINTISGTYDVDGVLIKNGLKSNIEACRNQIQDALNFKNYLGKELWLEFCAYRREDKYSNDNYISDGLDNAELFKKAKEFFEVAEKEIYKSAELQYSISTTLNNLLAISKFKPLVESFKTGNWIRVQVDDKIYKLRLLEYDINYGDFDNISVEFSDVTKIKNGITDVQKVLSQASSMATSYNSVKRQASQGEKSNAVLSNWFNNGLDATNTKIVGTENQNQVWDKNGILCREYDPITKTYSDEQLKIINSTIAITDDNWNTTKTAIGKYFYSDPVTGELKTAYGINGETIVGKLLVGENLIVSTGNNKLSFDDNGLAVSGKDKSEVRIQPSEESSIFNIKNNNGDYVLYLDNDSGNLTIKGEVISTKLEIENDDGSVSNLSNIAVSGSYNDLKDKPTLSKVATSGDYEDLLNTPTKLSDFTNDKSFITKDVDDLANYYKKSEVDSALSSKVNASDLATVATSGSYNDLIDIEELKNWVLEQIQLATNQDV